jgi:hypothetical protein
MLRFGIVYNVLQVVDSQTHPGTKSYQLAEFPSNFFFGEEYFSPIGDQDERSRLEAWQEENLTQEDAMLMALAESMPEEPMPQDSFDRVWEGIVNHLNPKQ